MTSKLDFYGVWKTYLHTSKYLRYINLPSRSLVGKTLNICSSFQLSSSHGTCLDVSNNSGSILGNGFRSNYQLCAKKKKNDHKEINC